jgi:nucleotide-binding universal stress UspA family protein
MKREKKIVIIAGPNGAGSMKTKSTVADADMSSAGRALERAAARARRLAEQTVKPLYIFRDGHVVDLDRRSGGNYVLREGRSGK